MIASRIEIYAIYIIHADVIGNRIVHGIEGEEYAILQTIVEAPVVDYRIVAGTHQYNAIVFVVDAVIVYYRTIGDPSKTDACAIRVMQVAIHNLEVGGSIEDVDCEECTSRINIPILYDVGIRDSSVARYDPIVRKIRMIKLGVAVDGYWTMHRV